MKIVADANILFSLAKPLTVANLLAHKFSLRLIAPDFALIELYKYKEEIEGKSGIDFDSAIESIKKKVVFIDNSEYSETLQKFSGKISDEKDIPYLALASKFELPIWSNDKHLKEQAKVDVFTTAELIELLIDCEE